MKCWICNQDIQDGEKLTATPNGAAHIICPSGTERSGAAQRCPPSAMGSASAAPQEPKAVNSQPAPMASLPSNGKAEDEASDDSSVVQLPVSDPAGPKRGCAAFRCCATCADWIPNKMECRYVADEAAPPESSCDGWRLNLNPHQYWHGWARQKALESGSQNAMTSRQTQRSGSERRKLNDPS